MTRALCLALLLCTAPMAAAQRNELWSNPRLAERGASPGEQQLVLRQDMSACHGSAFERTRGVEDEQKRRALGIALFNECMAQKGWSSRQPLAPDRAPKARRATST